MGTNPGCRGGKPATNRLSYGTATKLTPWRLVLLEKLQVAQLLENVPTFYATGRFITVFTTVRHWSLTSARRIQSIPPHPISLMSVLILSSYLRLGLPGGLFPSGFPSKTLYAFVFSPTSVLHALPISSRLITFGEEYSYEAPH
jgi:hypothetical protein